MCDVFVVAAIEQSARHVPRRRNLGNHALVNVIRDGQDVIFKGQQFLFANAGVAIGTLTSTGDAIGGMLRRSLQGLPLRSGALFQNIADFDVIFVIDIDIDRSVRVQMSQGQMGETIAIIVAVEVVSDRLILVAVSG